MTLNHRVPGSSPGAPTIQFHQTADFQAESKQAVSVGIFAGIILLFQFIDGPRTLAAPAYPSSQRSGGHSIGCR
jgi:hypothetical protein